MRINHLCCLIYLILVACETKVTNQSSGTAVINMEQAFNKKEQFNLSRIARMVDYIPLESKEECLIDAALRVFLSKDYIITIAARQMVLFDRHTGKFVREIGHFGKDPSGYGYTLFVMPYDEQKEVLYAGGWNTHSYYGYSFDNKLIKKINASPNTDSFARLNDSINVAYIKNYSGEEEKKLVLFNEENSCVKYFPNYSKFEINTKDVVSWGIEGSFYRFNNSLYFYELFNDTIFEVSEDKLAPRYILNKGKYAPPYEKKMSVEFMDKEAIHYFLMRNVYESQNNVFFSFRYENSEHLGLYSKLDQKTYMFDSGLGNDLDNFVPFYPKSIYQNRYLTGSVEASEILEWFKNNPELAKKLPANLQKLRDMKETDNPVIMIAELKE